MSARRPPVSGVVGAIGPLACEEALLDDLRELLPGSLEDLASDPRPTLVVVPSRSLRRHLLARVADRLGSVVGLEILTLRRTAARLLEIAGRTEPQGEWILEMLLRRAAARQPALSRPLGDLEDGLDAAVQSMRDLVDAGFEAELASALEEALAAGPRDAAVERARGLVRATAAALREAARLRLGGGADLYRAAREELLLRGPAALPARAVLVHGFADATGVATDLLAALAARAPARVHLDLSSPSPTSQTGSTDHPFGRCLRERLLGVAPFEWSAGPPPTVAAAAPAAFVAATVRHEVREVGWRALALLAKAVPAERIGVVARDLGAYAVALRTEWTELGIPFSGESPIDLGGPAARRLVALLELVERRGATPVERWLALRGGDGTAPFDLRAALFLLGASRLERIAEIDPDRHLPARDFPLPLRDGLGSAEMEAAPVAERRHLPRERLLTALHEGRALAAQLGRWPDAAGLAHHLRAFHGLRRLVAATATEADEAALDDALAALERECPPGLALEREEFARLLRRALGDAFSVPLGGRGAGVQVLDVTATRGRTFDHLFLLGLHAGSFPRPVAEDPILPDRVRSQLVPLLPDLPRKLEGRDEERVLFAQLLRAAPEVTISRPLADDAGRPLPISPLLAGLAPTAPRGAVTPLSDRDGPRDLPPAQALLAAALDLPRAALPRMLAAALDEHDLRAAVEDRRRRAEAHLAVLAELDPDLTTSEGRARRHSLGPYFGFVGRPVLAADPRRRELAVTTLEAVCTCPWRAFLERMLHLELPPDAAEELPTFEASRLGRLVHEVLERLGAAADSPRPDLATAASRSPASVGWPTGERLSAMTITAAERLLGDAGLARWGLAPAEAARALPYLETARALDGGLERLLGVEVEGRWTSRQGPATTSLAFRVDRVERIEGRLVLTDFKTGRSRSARRSRSGRERELLRAVASGRRLQAAVYARAAAELEPATAAGADPAPTPVGRYLSLEPGLGDDEREIAAGAEDRDLADALDSAVAAGSAVLAHGALFPRLLDPRLEQAADVCSRCRVAAACLQHDSGARLRLAARLGDLRRGTAEPVGPEEAALAALFDLDRPPSGDER